MQRIAISSSALAVIHAAVARDPAIEACGLLFGAHDSIAAASVCANIAATPATHFEIDPAALFAALRAERTGGPTLAGYWHSHPSGSCVPSATDAAMAAGDGRLWLIVGAQAIGLWRAVAHGFEPVDWTQDDD